MDEFDEGGCLDHRVASVTASPSHQDHQKRAQPLATTGNDVIRDLVYERYRTFQSRANNAIDGLEVRSDQRAYFFERHRYREDCVGGGTHGEPCILADAGVRENGDGVNGTWTVCPTGPIGDQAPRAGT